MYYSVLHYIVLYCSVLVIVDGVIMYWIRVECIRVGCSILYGSLVD